MLEKDDSRLLIDPGSFTDLPDDLPSIDFVIVTEEHFDHLNQDNLDKVAQVNPNVRIYSTKAVAENLEDTDLNVTVVSGDQTIELGDYKVAFSENDHAVVYQKSPCKSLAITVDNDLLYYPSDTYRTIDSKVQILALPTSGPWFKVSECIEFANAIDSEIVLTTHNALNSETGNKVTHNFIVNNIDENRRFVHLNNGECIEI